MSFLAALLLTAAAAPVFEDAASITNPYAPFEPGTVQVLTGRETGKRSLVVLTHLDETRTFEYSGMQVECRQLRELEFISGQMVDASLQFFGEDTDGNLHTFGEISTRFAEDGSIDHSGSWLVGGATLPSDPEETLSVADPALAMPAQLAVGDVFQPEYIPGVEEETVTVLRVDAKLKIPGGVTQQAVLLEERDDLTGFTERQWIVPGIGLVRIRGKGERLTLNATSLSEVDLGAS